MRTRREYSHEVALDVVARLLERAVPALARVRRAAYRLAAVGVAAAAVVTWALFRGGFPEAAETLVRVVLCLLVLAPPVVLVLLGLALSEVIGLPDRVRGLPAASREHLAELEQLLREAEDTRRSRSRRLRAVWRLVRLGRSTRDVIAVYAPLAALLSWPFLLGSVAAAFCVVVEAVVALAVLVALA
jgi:hypothetical protein